MLFQVMMKWPGDVASWTFVQTGGVHLCKMIIGWPAPWGAVETVVALCNVKEVPTVFAVLFL